MKVFQKSKLPAHRKLIFSKETQPFDRCTFYLYCNITKHDYLDIFLFIELTSRLYKHFFCSCNYKVYPQIVKLLPQIISSTKVRMLIIINMSVGRCRGRLDFSFKRPPPHPRRGSAGDSYIFRQYLISHLLPILRHC